jgi:hypothetical protein
LEEGTEGGNSSSWADHDDWFARVGGELEVTVSSVRRKVDSIVFISRTFDGVGDSVGMRIGFAVLLGFEGEEIVRGDAVKDFFAVCGGTSFDNSGDVRCIRVDFTARRDGVITRDHVIERFENEREGYLSPRLTAGDRFHDLSNVETTMGNALSESIFITTKTSHFGFRMFGGCELGESGERLTTHGSTDFEIVTEHGFVCRWSGYRDFSGGIGAADFDDGLALVFHAKNAEKTIDFTVGIGGPDGKMVASLVGKTGSFEGDLHVETIALLGGENLAGFDDRRDERIV